MFNELLYRLECIKKSNLLSYGGTCEALYKGII